MLEQYAEHTGGEHKCSEQGGFDRILRPVVPQGRERCCRLYSGSASGRRRNYLGLRHFYSEMPSAREVIPTFPPRGDQRAEELFRGNKCPGGEDLGGQELR